ncbi:MULTISPECIES: GNAT family N-acetyltransferase [unclassified Spirosoma]|uniref:GNAT family N-acetyltransferase n=1 Tax=unclassified Spirosoma TaxID=2621999 RepID=UPI00095D5961|nr:MULTISPECIES: GNAT family N-acetyltransferase [unclassified Spirosoma]MBN8822087.1 GNAT family N-acetyltransferase [Spirosoma sp.]OJW80488.1 MAG: hypothetical protein BGO59_33965 [Spirosoma sp. 48-14]
MTNIRPFTHADIDPLLTVFARNVPTAFGENEQDEYADFLQTYTDPYFVVEYKGTVVGACGYYLTDNQTVAHICWILTDPTLKGLRLGTALIQHNLQQIRQQPGIQQIECRTSQIAFGFFERFGFQLQYTKTDFWAPGIDLYFMVLT